jgi:hypothetical protein
MSPLSILNDSSYPLLYDPFLTRASISGFNRLLLLLKSSGF